MFRKTWLIATTAAVLGATALPAAANHEERRDDRAAGAGIADSRHDDRRYSDRYDRRYYDSNGKRYNRGGAPANYESRDYGYERNWRSEGYRGGPYYRDGKYYPSVEVYLDSRRGDGG